MTRHLSWVLLAAACVAPAPPHPIPAPVVVTPPSIGTGSVLVAPVRPLDRHDAALAAYRAGLMPTLASGINEFSQLYPERDGRGVLIAILDSGIDPAAPGLQRTSDGRPKLVDLRDFSGEGRIALEPATIIGDTIQIGARRLGGAGVVRARTGGTVWGGVVAEVRFGAPPAADLNGNGRGTDSLLVVVGRGTDGWALYADARGDGSLADDRPIHDYRVAQEWFGWSRADVPPIGIAVNLDDQDGEPILDLVFDNSGHGTHVAGIAAGHRLYDVAGFDGTAPGARLLGLKIANNADGGITRTGSMRAALLYAIAVAAERRLPLVVNLSFGVGNQREGTADIDRIIDSILTAHPDVVMTVAASNDGPGLSTLGFPASASRVLAIGATMPLVFDGLSPERGRRDPVAFFSSRGGERAGPDLVAPGVAWSSVPRFDYGAEEKNGTSMAAPYVAGLVARLANVLRAGGRPQSRALIHQALCATAVSLPDVTVLDQGAGLPDIGAAARWLSANREVPELVATDVANPDRNAIWFAPGAPPATARLRLQRRDREATTQIRFRSNAPWLAVAGPSVKTLPVDGMTVQLDLARELLRAPGVYIATLSLEDAANEGLGVLLRVPVTVRIPLPATGGAEVAVTVHPGAAERFVFAADTGRGVRIRANAVSRDGQLLLALHEPGGQPFRDVPMAPAGGEGQEALIEIDARDVRPGSYEMVLLAPPTTGVAAKVGVTLAPVRLGAKFERDTLRIAAVNLVTDTIVTRLRTAFTGVEWQASLGGPRVATMDTLIPVPAWADQMVIDVAMAEADWSRFTDFGVTLWRRDGRLVQAEPLNYAFGRMRVDVPVALRGETLRLELSPADALPDRATPWRVEVSVRFHPVNATPLDDGGGTLTLAPDAGSGATYPVRTWPVVIPAGMSPLIAVVALEGDGGLWSREIVLPRVEEKH